MGVTWLKKLWTVPMLIVVFHHLPPGQADSSARIQKAGLLYKRSFLPESSIVPIGDQLGVFCFGHYEHAALVDNTHKTVKEIDSREMLIYNISSVHCRDAGTWTCKAGNSQRPVTLLVGCPPHVRHHAREKPEGNKTVWKIAVYSPTNDIVRCNFRSINSGQKGQRYNCSSMNQSWVGTVPELTVHVYPTHEMLLPGLRWKLTLSNVYGTGNMSLPFLTENSESVTQTTATTKLPAMVIRTAAFPVTNTLSATSPVTNALSATSPVTNTLSATSPVTNALFGTSPTTIPTHQSANSVAPIRSCFVILSTLLASILSLLGTEM